MKRDSIITLQLVVPLVILMNSQERSQSKQASLPQGSCLAEAGSTKFNRRASAARDT